VHEEHMSFEGWAAQGVLMLPRLLTARQSFVGGHDGWLRYTSIIIREVVQISYTRKICAVLFGKENHVFEGILSPKGSRSQIKTFCVNYPKSFDEGDFDIFERVNARFLASSEPEIDWRKINV
jgi:uracil DNA glycosylase